MNTPLPLLACCNRDENTALVVVLIGEMIRLVRANVRWNCSLHKVIIQERTGQEGIHIPSGSSLKLTTSARPVHEVMS
jgi:hypothetical protein